jgi:hypothetical protein
MKREKQDFMRFCNRLVLCSAPPMATIMRIHPDRQWRALIAVSNGRLGPVSQWIWKESDSSWLGLIDMVIE